MKQYFLDIYILEIETQIGFAKTCYQNYFNCRQKQKKNYDNHSVFMWIHHFLIHCINISKILFPTVCKRDSADVKKIKNERKKSLARVFKNYHGSNLHDFKNLRNHLEHFDERIDRWIINSKNHNFCDMNISHGGSLLVEGLDKTDYFRNLESNCFTFAGEEYELKELHRIILEIEKLNKIWKIN